MAKGNPEDVVSLAVLWNSKLVLALLSGAYDQCPKLADETAKHLDGLVGTPMIPLHHLASAYGRAQAAPKDRSTARALKTALSKHQKWQAMSPGNYEAPYLLLMGLSRQLRGDSDGADRFFGQAIESAQKHQLPIVEALAHLATRSSEDDPAGQHHHDQAAEIWADIGNIAGLSRLQDQRA